MTNGAPLVLIALELMLTASIRAMQRFGDNPHSLSNIELLVPLTLSDSVASDESAESDADAAGERYDRARIDKDSPFSNIPASAFVLDESATPFAHKKKKRGHKHSRKQDLAYLPRSVYLESAGSASAESGEAGELGGDVWRACQRLTSSQAGHQHELLLLLCAELLDAPPAPPAPPACACCQHSAGPWPGPPAPARREFVGLGGDPYMVRSYMRSRDRKRRYRMPGPSQR